MFVHLPEVRAYLPSVSIHLPDVFAGLPSVSIHLPDVSAEFPRVSAGLPCVFAVLPRLRDQLPLLRVPLLRIFTRLPPRCAGLRRVRFHLRAWLARFMHQTTVTRCPVCRAALQKIQPHFHPMNERITRRYDKFQREITFFHNHKADFATASEAAKRTENLERIVSGMNDAKAGQGGGSATPKEVLLDALRLDLGNIRALATAIDQDEPGFAERFPTPGNSEASLLTIADKYLAQFVIDEDDSAAEKAAKTALVARFVAHELPATFVEDLQADLADIAEANQQLASGDLDGVENTAALGRLAREGTKESNYLGAIMRVKYARNPDKLRAWESASRLERAAVRTRKEKPANGTTPTSPAAPQPILQPA